MRSSRVHSRVRSCDFLRRERAFAYLNKRAFSGEGELFFSRLAHGSRRSFTATSGESQTRRNNRTS